jgi:hypothetical protein
VGDIGVGVSGLMKIVEDEGFEEVSGSEDTTRLAV